MTCIHEEYKIILETKGAKLKKCSFCDLILVNKKNLSDKDETYKNYYKDSGGRFGFGIEQIVKFFRYLRAWKISDLNPEAKSILDIGSGRGWMLYYLREYFGYKNVAGTQISKNAYRFSKEKLGLEIYNQDLLELNFENKFDIITLWHVLEHVENPEAYIGKICELLADNGLLLIEVPNFDSWSRKLSQKHWLALDLKHHLTFFTPSSLINLLKKYDFKVKKINTFSLEYSTFTSAQSMVNLITDSDDYFFESLQKRNFGPKMIFHSLLFLILFPVCLIINLALYFSKSGEVINIIAEKNDK